MTIVTFAPMPACATAAVGGWYRPPHRCFGLRRRPDLVDSLSRRHAAGVSTSPTFGRWRAADWTSGWGSAGQHGRPCCPAVVGRRGHCDHHRLASCLRCLFDVLTSRGSATSHRWSRRRPLIEPPLAAVCFWRARNLAHAVDVARPFLQPDSPSPTTSSSPRSRVRPQQVIRIPHPASPARKRQRRAIGVDEYLEPETTGFQDSIAPTRRDN